MDNSLKNRYCKTEVFGYNASFTLRKILGRFGLNNFRSYLFNMVAAVKDLPINLFEGQIPSVEEYKRLREFVNSSQRMRQQFASQSQSHPDTLRSGLGLYLAGHVQEAMAKLQSAPEHLLKYIVLGWCYRHLKQFQQAIEMLDKASASGAEMLTVCLEKAETYRQAGQLDKARQQLASCANYENVSSGYHYQLGRLADAEGNYALAGQHYQKAVELDPQNAEAVFQLAYFYDLRGQEDKAIYYYRELTKRVPPPVSALLNLAVLYEDRGEYEKAAVMAEMVCLSHPNHARAMLYQKDFESARTMVYDEEKEKRKDRQNKILEIPISDFELSVRSRNCLKKMNINTLGDLLRTTEAELLSYKNFGETSLIEIKRILESKGLRLGMALEKAESKDDIPEPRTVQAPPEVLKKSIDELELSVRARRALERLNVQTLQDLIGKTEAELLACKNFGMTSLNEIKEKLAQYNLTLRKLES